MYEVEHALSANGVDIYQGWLDTIRDTRSKARITTRIDRAALGHFGVTEPVGDGVFEMKLDFGPGFWAWILGLDFGCITRSRVKKYYFSWVAAQRTSSKTI
ncbi:type II toxin-antitoxin system RelE/ParE family toxin [Pseudomonas syringae]|uniref:type II toxin-antitoxin system RelE/ParE family toxin n=1 Tax=Pseudomonas syringae TaxID=317 RepID=UPI002156102F